MLIAICIVAVLIILFVVLYNNLVRGKELVNEAFSGMDVYLKKRYDLIPNLIECVKAYMTHEKGTLEKVVSLRNASQKPGMNAEQRLQAESDLTKAVTILFALAENYPTLKADTQFTELQQQLSDVETDIAQARKYYNGAAKKFNIQTQTIPSNIVASLCGFKSYPYFTVDEAAERENVKVDFSK